MNPLPERLVAWLDCISTLLPSFLLSSISSPFTTLVPFFLVITTVKPSFRQHRRCCCRKEESPLCRRTTTRGSVNLFFRFVGGHGKPRFAAKSPYCLLIIERSRDRWPLDIPLVKRVVEADDGVFLSLLSCHCRLSDPASNSIVDIVARPNPHAASHARLANDPSTTENVHHQSIRSPRLTGPTPIEGTPDSRPSSSRERLDFSIR
jgi:hypothetical protein